MPNISVRPPLCCFFLHQNCKSPNETQQTISLKQTIAFRSHWLHQQSWRHDPNVANSFLVWIQPMWKAKSKWPYRRWTGQLGQCKSGESKTRTEINDHYPIFFPYGVLAFAPFGFPFSMSIFPTLNTAVSISFDKFPLSRVTGGPTKPDLGGIATCGVLGRAHILFFIFTAPFFHGRPLWRVTVTGPTLIFQLTAMRGPLPNHFCAWDLDFFSPDICLCTKQLFLSNPFGIFQSGVTANKRTHDFGKHQACMQQHSAMEKQAMPLRCKAIQMHQAKLHSKRKLYHHSPFVFSGNLYPKQSRDQFQEPTSATMLKDLIQGRPLRAPCGLIFHPVSILFYHFPPNCVGSFQFPDDLNQLPAKFGHDRGFLSF